MTAKTIDEAERESVRARIRVAVDLAIGNSPAQARRALTSVAPAAESSGDEIAALYFQACAIADVKARRTRDGFAAFERALQAARRHGEPALCARILINYGTAAIQDGDVSSAIAGLEEALAMSRTIERTRTRSTVARIRALASTKPVALISLAEAYFAAGDARRAAAMLHEFHSMRTGDAANLLTAASVGIPVGAILRDESLLRLSHDPSLLDLAFARYEQWLRGPLVEAFCAYYELDGRREAHDALLERAVGALDSLDNSLMFAIRLARLGAAHHLPRINALVARQCAGDSALMGAYRDLFDSFVAARRQTLRRAHDLALRAERVFEQAGRPLLRGLALQAASAPAAATALFAALELGEVATLRWCGAAVKRRLAAQLTPRESEVAGLAAAGLTNRSIAARLSLSERTVHHHCEAIFGKLGIRSRWQLASALAGVSDHPSA